MQGVTLPDECVILCIVLQLYNLLDIREQWVFWDTQLNIMMLSWVYVRKKPDICIFILFLVDKNYTIGKRITKWRTGCALHLHITVLTVYYKCAYWVQHVICLCKAYANRYLFMVIITKKLLQKYRRDTANKVKILTLENINQKESMPFPYTDLLIIYFMALI